MRTFFSSLRQIWIRATRNQAAPRYRHMLKDDSGAALMMAVFTMTMLLAVSMDTLFETSVEMQVSGQAINQVKAYYAAKSGVEISLLRIHIYKKAVAMLDQIPQQMRPPRSMLDPIWQFPFAWPPVVPGDTSSVDKDMIKDTVKKSLMQGQYLATIESEGSKIDINDLASPSKVIADATRQQILQIFNSKMENDEAFSQRYRGYDFDRLVNNITDWIDADTESRNGGDESGIYADRPRSDFIPANQPLKTLQELHLVEGMTDEFYNILAPRITIYGIKGVNVNTASKDVLMSLTPEITEERADKIIEGRNDPNRGPFKDTDDFVQFLQTVGVSGDPFREGNSKQEKVPLFYDAEYNFRVRSQGISGKVTRDITAIVYDFDRVKARLKELATGANPTQSTGTNNQSQSTAGGNTGKGANSGKSQQPTKVPNERPTIVYWNEN